jgi:hypothetical protein
VHRISSHRLIALFLIGVYISFPVGGRLAELTHCLYHELADGQYTPHQHCAGQDSDVQMRLPSTGTHAHVSAPTHGHDHRSRAQSQSGHVHRDGSVHHHSVDDSLAAPADDSEQAASRHTHTAAIELVLHVVAAHSDRPSGRDDESAPRWDRFDHVLQNLPLCAVSLAPRERVHCDLGPQNESSERRPPVPPPRVRAGIRT